MTAKPAASSTGPLIVWLVLQLLVLGIVVLRIPLAARYPEPPETLALHWILCTQVAIAAMMFPLLLRDTRCAAQVLATAVPFQVAAMYLAGRGIADSIHAITFVDAWLVTFAIWSRVLRSDPLRAIGICITTCFTLGGGILQYMRAEFAADSSSARFEEILPLASTLAAIENAAIQKSWVFPGIFGLLGVVTLALHRLRTCAAILATSYPPTSSPPSAG